jgi:hypothetical protein
VLPPSNGNERNVVNTVMLYRPVGDSELQLIERSGFRSFPPRLPGQPIFYPVVNEEYAAQIAREWNARGGKRGHVARFAIEAGYIGGFEIHQVGGRIHQEYWIPAELLDEFNRHIVGLIEIVATFCS